jgi:hypothetical protein
MTDLGRLIKLPLGAAIVCLLTFLFFSCAQEKNKQSEIIEFNLPISTKQSLTYSKAFISNSTLYGFNRNQFGLDEISIDSNLQEPAKLAIHFEQQGPQAVAAPWHMASYNGKIYLCDSYQNLTVLGDSFQVEHQQHLDFESSGITLGFGNGYTVNPPIAVSTYEGQAILPLYKLIPRTTKGYYDSLYFAEIDLRTFDYKIKSFPLPADFSENYWPIHDAYYIQKVGDDQYIISFKAMAAVFVGSDKQLVKRHGIDLSKYNLNKAVGSLPKSYDQIAAYRNKEYARGSQLFLPLRYNANENTFYRVVKGETAGESPVPRKNLHLFKYNRNFELLNYTKLPDGLLGDFILDGSKLYFQHSEVTAEDEEVFRLSVIAGF